MELENEMALLEAHIVQNESKLASVNLNITQLEMESSFVETRLMDVKKKRDMLYEAGQQWKTIALMADTDNTVNYNSFKSDKEQDKAEFQASIAEIEQGCKQYEAFIQRYEQQIQTHSNPYFTRFVQATLKINELERKERQNNPMSQTETQICENIAHYISCKEVMQKIEEERWSYVEEFKLIEVRLSQVLQFRERINNVLRENNINFQLSLLDEQEQ